MPAGSEFGDHPSVAGMDIDLGGDDAGENLPPVANNGSGGFVTGRFEAKKKHENRYPVTGIR
jgi:hypothetical protein